MHVCVLCVACLIYDGDGIYVHVEAYIRHIFCVCVSFMLVWGDVECMVYMLGMMCDMCVYVWCMCVWSY